MTISLRPYQQTLITNAYAAYQAGARNVLAVLPTGGGKSVIVSQMILDGHMQGLIEAVIAHRNELVGQMSLHVARRGIKHRIIASAASVKQITASHRREFGKSFVNPDARCSVVSVDTLIARKDALAAWALQVNRWTIDECFPAGTLISTPTGYRPIEVVRVGDMVTAFDERTGAFHARRVARLFKNPMPKNMVRIDTATHHVLTTPGHPFWTARGWVRAMNLTLNDEILTDGYFVHGLRGTGDVSLLGPQETVRGNGPSILQHSVQQGVSSTGIVRDNGAHEPSTCIGTHDAQQSDETRSITREDVSDVAPDQTQARGARGQWETDTVGRTEVDRYADGVRVSTAVCDTNRFQEGERVSHQLQAGHGATLAEDSCGSGRRITPITVAPEAGRDQGCIFTMCRVEGVALHQPRDIRTARDGYVYNIEVDDFHTYVANGIVVHNCHHVLAQNKWGKAVSMFPHAYGLGVTATPRRADGMGLGRHHDGVFDDMVIGPSMRELIEIGALCDYEIAVPPSDFEISDDDLAASGDWSTARMREASKRSHIVGDVVVEYAKRALGKRAICFATDVETAGEMAERFKAVGITAAAVSAKTPSETRDEYIRRFRDGSITVLVNVDLFGEGFDVPAVEVVIMARPTASLAVYLQQFGRALRTLAGKAFGLVIDHVSNWKRHGFPDKPHVWSLDRREKRAKREPDPEDIPLTSCRECSRPYERCLPACPYCGFEVPPPEGGARSLQQVDGDLMLLDRDMLAQMRAAIQLESPASVAERVSFAAGPVAGKGAANRAIERHAAQARLRGAIEQWAGIQRYKGRSDQEGYRRFYLATGIDVLTALTLDRADMEKLAETVEGWYQ